MILVVGQARARTSLMMQTQMHLGVPVLGEFVDTKMNPRGNGESPQTSAGIDTALLPVDVAVKVMTDAFLFRSKVHAHDKVIYCLRAPAAVVRSQGETHVNRYDANTRRWNYWRLTSQFWEWKAANPDIPCLVVDTDDLIRDPETAVGQIASFIGRAPTRAAIENISPALTKMGDPEIEDPAWITYSERRSVPIEAEPPEFGAA